MNELKTSSCWGKVRGCLVGVLCGFLRLSGFLCGVLVIAWGALAIYWSDLPWSWVRLVLAGGFVCVGGVAFWVVKSLRSFVIFGVVFGGVLVWWVMIQPSHDRVWRREVAVLPRALVEGDHVTLTGVRNFDYRSATDFEEQYLERQVDLSHLVGVDFFVSYWKLGPVAHTFVSFIFDNADPICVSIEARLEQGEKYSPLASCFKQAELIYVVGEERDVVRVRTNYRNEMVYLYHVKVRPEGARWLFLNYLTEINRLATQPEFYHLLRNNCTTNIARHSNKSGARGEFDIRKLLNGYVDAYVYAKGALDTSMSFEELRKRSLITEPAILADQGADFSSKIRQHLPTGL